MAGAVRVLQSVRRPRRTTNPYVVQLVEAVPPPVEVRWFSWRTALAGRYDVLHLHWPEVLLRRDGAAAQALARARFALLLVRLAVLRTPVVRTLHNVRPHEGGGRVEGALLAAGERLTTHWVRLSDDTPAPPRGASTVVLHGHYTDWYAAQQVPGSVPGRLLHFGLLRPYKGVEDLLAAVAALPRSAGAALRVVGSPTTPQLRALVEDACRGDERVTALLEYVDDATLAREVGEAQLVVLPYRDMHNSGALLLALSLGRPALVPATPTTRRLAAEVGDAWVRTYFGELTPEVLLDGLRATAGLCDGGAAPDLSARDWSRIGAQHAGVYRAALAQRGASSRAAGHRRHGQRRRRAP